MSTVDKKRASTAQLPAWQNFLFSTIAPQFAVLFTNPFDTAKVIVRMNIFASQIINMLLFERDQTCRELQLRSGR